MTEQEKVYDEELRNAIRKALDEGAKRGVGGMAALGALALNAGDLIGGSSVDRKSLRLGLEIFQQVVTKQAKEGFAHWQAEDAKTPKN